jgi:hypothetical protein
MRLFVLMFVGGLCMAQAARAGVLLDAPAAGGSYYGMYCFSCNGASFTLTGAYDVSTIDVALYTPTLTSFTTFDFSLQSSATSVITSEALTVTNAGYSTEVMNVNEILQPGTFYLIGNVPGYFGSPVTPGDVDGWQLSTGLYSGGAGTIANGVGSFSGNTWSLYHPSSVYTAPAFTVNGSAVPEVPEPRSTIPIAIIAALTELLRRKNRRSHS